MIASNNQQPTTNNQQPTRQQVAIPASAKFVFFGECQLNVLTLKRSESVTPDQNTSPKMPGPGSENYNTTWAPSGSAAAVPLAQAPTPVNAPADITPLLPTQTPIAVAGNYSIAEQWEAAANTQTPIAVAGNYTTSTPLLLVPVPTSNRSRASKGRCVIFTVIGCVSFLAVVWSVLAFVFPG